MDPQNVSEYNTNVYIFLPYSMLYHYNIVQ